MSSWIGGSSGAECAESKHARIPARESMSVRRSMLVKSMILLSTQTIRVVEIAKCTTRDDYARIPPLLMHCVGCHCSSLTKMSGRGHVVNEKIEYIDEENH
jgi:hypothetical protein